LGTLSKAASRNYWPDTYDITDPKVHEFMENVLTEIIGLFPYNVIHIGGDEVRYSDWKKMDHISNFMKDNQITSYPNLQIWGINKMSDFLSSRSYRIMGWNEITGEHAQEKEKYPDKLGKLSQNAIIHF